MFFPLEIFVEVDFSCFQSVFQTEREREREREGGGGGEREGERERELDLIHFVDILSL